MPSNDSAQPGAGPREVVLVVFDRVQSLDVTGPLEVFAGADRWARTTDAGSAYSTTLAARDAAEVRTSSGLGLRVDADLAEVATGAGARIDTLVVAGGDGVHEARRDPAVVAEVARLAGRARRVTSVCTGAFLLAEAGLLDGRRATTHWSRCEQLASDFPAVTVEPDPIFVRDGPVLTSAGVTAGMDLALAMVEDDLGRDAALVVARWLVLFLRRPAGQSQFSAPLRAQLADRDEVRALQSAIVERPADDCSVEALARRAAMSPRHLARLFAEQVGTTPARWVEQIRVEAARRRLEESGDPIGQVAADCGFGTPETLRRAFVRALGVPPAEYRRRFRTTTA